MLAGKIKSLFNKSVKQKKAFCYAPFGSLYFTLDGRINACYNNRMYVLGHYPANSVSEVWNGKRIKHLRKCIQKHNLTRGCLGCSSLVSDIYKPNQQYDFLKNYGKYPENLEFQLNNSCNLACKMCVNGNSVNVKTHSANHDNKCVYDSKFVDQIEEYLPHLKSSFFLGGEPFLIDIFYEIWERIVKINNNICISLTSNGTVLNERVKNILEKGNFNIMISVDSFVENKYENIRRGACFKSTLQNVEYFADYMKMRGKNLQINVCLLKDNWEEIPSIFEYCCNKNYIVYVIFAIVPKQLSLKYLNSGEIKKILSLWKQHQNSIPWNVFPANKLFYENMINQLEIWASEAAGFENSSLYKTENNNALLDIFNSRLHESFKSELKYLSKYEQKQIMLNLENAMKTTSAYLNNEDEFKSLLKTMLRFPVHEFATEGLITKQDKLFDCLLMFR